VTPSSYLTPPSLPNPNIMLSYRQMGPRILRDVSNLPRLARVKVTPLGPPEPTFPLCPLSPFSRRPQIFPSHPNAICYLHFPQLHSLPSPQYCIIMVLQHSVLRSTVHTQGPLPFLSNHVPCVDRIEPTTSTWFSFLFVNGTLLPFTTCESRSFLRSWPPSKIFEVMESFFFSPLLPSTWPSSLRPIR